GAIPLPLYYARLHPSRLVPQAGFHQAVARASGRHLTWPDQGRG
ncbi:hypothetical protein HaLaN_14680, partial [Haematococcus lacustris]